MPTLLASSGRSVQVAARFCCFFASIDAVLAVQQPVTNAIAPHAENVSLACHTSLSRTQVLT
jgi:hypothetical protein